MVNVVDVEVFFHLVSSCLLNPAGNDSDTGTLRKGSTLGWVGGGTGCCYCLSRHLPFVAVSCPTTDLSCSCVISLIVGSVFTVHRSVFCQ